MRARQECNLNLCTTLPRKNHDFYRLLKIGICSSFKKFLTSMERSPESHKRFVRRTMMDQEKIFKQQVCELHRIYDVQKSLMAEVRCNEVTKLGNTASAFKTSHYSYTSIRYTSGDQFSPEDKFLQSHNKRSGPSSQELSFHSGGPSRRQKGCYLDWPHVDDDNSVAIQNDVPILFEHSIEKTSTSGPKLCSNEDSEIDLTLSIGYGSSKKK